MSEEIRTLLGQYADAVMRHDADQWGATWTTDAVWDMGALKLEGRDKMVETWSGIMQSFDGVVHSYTDGWATLDQAAGTGSGRWYVNEYLKPSDDDARIMMGFYDDEYALVDGAWKFSKRTLTSIYRGGPDFSGEFVGFGQPAHGAS